MESQTLIENREFKVVREDEKVLFIDYTQNLLMLAAQILRRLAFVVFLIGAFGFYPIADIFKVNFWVVLAIIVAIMVLIIVLSKVVNRWGWRSKGLSGPKGEPIVAIADETSKSLLTPSGNLFANFYDADILVLKKREPLLGVTLRITYDVKLKKSGSNILIYKADSTMFFDMHGTRHTDNEAVEKEMESFLKILTEIGLTRIEQEEVLV